MIFIVGTVVKLHKIIFGYYRTKFYMNVSLWLYDTGDNAVQIFSRFLNIFYITRFVQFKSLKNIARFPLIGDGDRYNVQFIKRLYFIVLITHAEHFNNTLISRIVSVLCPSVSLSNPN